MRKIRVSVASVAVLSEAQFPKHIDFTVNFVHPCRYAEISGDMGLHIQLDSAVVNGISDETTISPFPLTFPTLTGSTFECGTQIVTVVEPAPAYSSGPVSNFISIMQYDASSDSFGVKVVSTNEAEADVGTFSLQLYVHLENFPEINFTSSSFEVTITSCSDDSFASFEWLDSSTEITQFDFVINDGTQDIDFMTGQNTLHSSCNPQYTLHKEEEGGAFVEYTGTVVSFDSGFTKAQIITTASDYSLDQEEWRMRLSVASVTDLVAASSPSHIYFTVKFVHPCHFA